MSGFLGVICFRKKVMPAGAFVADSPRPLSLHNARVLAGLAATDHPIAPNRDVGASLGMFALARPLPFSWS